MKQFLYFLTFSLSVGTIGLVVTNPQFVQQGASFFSFAAENIHESPAGEPDSPEEHLSKFLSRYPYAGNDSEAVPNRTPSTESETPSTLRAQSKTGFPRVPPPSFPASSESARDGNAGFSGTHPVASPEAAGMATTRPTPPERGSEVGFASSSGRFPSTDSNMLFDQWSEPPLAEPVHGAPAPETVSPELPPRNDFPPGPFPPITASTISGTVPPANPVSPPIPATTPPAEAPSNFPFPPPSVPAPQAFGPPAIATPTTVPPTTVSPPSPPTIPPMPVVPSPPATHPAAAPGHAVDPFALALGTVGPNGPPPISGPVAPPPTPQPRPETGTMHLQGAGEPASSPNLAEFNRPATTPMPAMPTSMPTSMPAPMSVGAVTALPMEQRPAEQNRQAESFPVQGSLPLPTARQVEPMPESPRQPVASQFQINPSILIEEVPCYGTETVARVGTQVILMCDLLPQLRREGLRLLQENLKKASPEEREQVTEKQKEEFVNMFVENQYPMFLQTQVTVTLIYNDFIMSNPREQREFFEKKLGEEFDEVEIPAMIKEYGVENLAALKQLLKEKLGSSIEQERMLSVRRKIAQQWIMHAVKNAEGECTHDEMMEYYTKHPTEFETKARCRWKELLVFFSSHQTEKEAWDKIVWMGNQVLAGASFDEMAKVNSEGFTASKGGLWDWTSKGSLTSQDLENAIFMQPVGKMGPIIKGDKGLHIIQVVEREDDRKTPFIEAQVTIREKIRMQRRQRHENEYFEELKRKYPTIVLREKIDFDLDRSRLTSDGGEAGNMK